MESTPKRKRAETGIVLQPRDLALLRGLFESRVMTAAHASSLFFDGRDEAAKTRLQSLKRAGFIRERPRLAFEPAKLSLSPSGLAELRARGVLSEYPPLPLSALERRADVSALTLGHELAVVSVKVAFHRAARGVEGIAIAEFGTWPRLYEFPSRDALRGPVRPDGFVRILSSDTDGESEHCFFVEVDNSTESVDTLAGKARDYLEHYRSGRFAESRGGSRADFRNYPFRVLMLFRTEERRNNVAERLLLGTPPILTQVLLSTMKAVESDPFGPVWMTPAAYREATAGSAFAPDGRAEFLGYRRKAERDEFIRKSLSPHQLLV